MLNFAKLVTVRHQTRVGFGAALDGAGFSAARPEGHQVLGYYAQEFLVELLAQCFGAGLQKGLAVKL